MDFQEQALDDDGANLGSFGNVFEDARERDFRAIDELEIIFGASVEFGPNFAVVGVPAFPQAERS